ncbi:MAG: PorV/PorQ family protein [Candidatus Cloacimonetes bacterium]|nr:PorV/PorQ family protein [Candidatus Cloacimonadota bacterium]
MKHTIIWLVIFGLIPAFAFAEMFPKSGTAGLQFLKLGIDARAIGMAEAYTAVSDDISAIYWNPGGLAVKYQNQVIFSHTEWPADIMHDYFAASYISDYGTFGFQASVLHMDDMPVRTADHYEGTGELFTCSDICIGLTYSQAFTDKFSFGITGKYLRENLSEYDVNGFAFDVGSLYNTGWNNLTIGMALRNFGPDLKYEIDNDGDGQIDEDPFDLLDNDGDGLIDEDREEFPLKIPMSFSFGISGDIIRDDHSHLISSFQIDNCVDREETFNLGFEYRWSALFVRSGCQFQIDTNESGVRPTFGLGWKVASRIGVINVDWAYTDMGWLAESFMTSAHRLSVKMAF